MKRLFTYQLVFALCLLVTGTYAQESLGDGVVIDAGREGERKTMRRETIL